MDAREKLIRSIFGPKIPLTRCEAILRNGIRCNNQTSDKRCSIHKLRPVDVQRYQKRIEQMKRLLEMQAPATIVVKQCWMIIEAYAGTKSK